jgi:hypothetical protein
MKIYRIAQFGRADEMADIEYQKYLEHKTINDIKIAIIGFFTSNEIRESLKIDIKPQRKSDNEIDLVVNISGPQSNNMSVLSYKTLMAKSFIRGLKEVIKNVTVVSPILKFNIREPSEEAFHKFKQRQKKLLEPNYERNMHDRHKPNWSMTNKDLAEVLNLLPNEINNKRPTSLSEYAVKWDKVDWGKSDEDIALENGIDVSKVSNKRFEFGK